jgi:hypothetical protein
LSKITNQESKGTLNLKIATKKDWHNSHREEEEISEIATNMFPRKAIGCHM